MTVNRKGNVREREKELLHLFVKSSGQKLEWKKEMKEDGRVRKGRAVGGGGGEDEGEQKRKRREGKGKVREGKGRGKGIGKVWKGKVGRNGYMDGDDGDGMGDGMGMGIGMENGNGNGTRNGNGNKLSTIFCIIYCPKSYMYPVSAMATYTSLSIEM
jgi:hypothetical protein